MAERITCSRGVTFNVKDIQKNQMGKVIQEVTYDGAEEFSDIDAIDFDVYDLTSTSNIVIQGEKAVVLGSSRNLQNIFAWVNSNTFHGAMDIRASVLSALTSSLDDTRRVAYNSSYYPLAGTLSQAHTSYGCGQIQIDWNESENRSDRLIMELGIDNATYTPKLPYNNTKELNSDGTAIPLGHLCVYAEYESNYTRRFDMPQGFAELFALLPEWEVNLVDLNTGIEKTLGKLENGVSVNMSVTTEENRSGYPSSIQSIIVTEKNSEITGSLSDLDPAVFNILNNSTINAKYKSTTETAENAIGTEIDFKTNSTSLPDYGLTLRGWFQSSILVQLEFKKAKIFPDGNIDVHNTASRVPFRLQPVVDGKMFVGANEGMLIKKPITCRVIVPDSPESPQPISAEVDGTALTLLMDVPMDDTTSPEVTDFVATVDGVDDTTSGVSVNGSNPKQLDITLTAGATAGDVVTLAYTYSTGDHAQDTCENTLEDFAGFNVTNITT